VCIQGEGVGRVCGNPLKLQENDLYVFNFITEKEGRIPMQAAKYIVEDAWGFKWVPFIGAMTLPETMEQTKQLASGMSKVNPSVTREGLVFRTFDNKTSFKNVSKEYLLSKKGK
jgi:ATP-dependent RNA circularization protein (DNA/RNA ligase family)